LTELNSGNYPNKENIIKTAQTIEILPRIKEIEEVAEIYINNYLMPKGMLGDAVHLAYTSIYKIDFLLTWNCKHIANANIKKKLMKLITGMGYAMPIICTPDELIKE